MKMAVRSQTAAGINCNILYSSFNTQAPMSPTGFRWFQNKQELLQAVLWPSALHICCQCNTAIAKCSMKPAKSRSCAAFPCTTMEQQLHKQVSVQTMCIGVYTHAPVPHSAGLRFLHLQSANAAPTPPFTAFMALLEIFVASCPF
jgi:hypothetical protein